MINYTNPQYPAYNCYFAILDDIGCTDWQEYYNDRGNLKLSASIPASSCCSTGYFECNNLNCITSSNVCNGNDDCGDNSDESYLSCNTPSPTTISV